MSELINWDCFEELKTMNNESIDCVFFDPPYWILKHKIETDINKDLLFKEFYRILKPNSFCIYFWLQPTFTDWNNNAFKYFKYKKEIIWYKCRLSSPLWDMWRMFENIMIVKKWTRKFNDIKLKFTDVTSSISDYLNIKTIYTYESKLRNILKNADKINKIIDYKAWKNVYTQEKSINYTNIVRRSLSISYYSRMVPHIYHYHRIFLQSLDPEYRLMITGLFEKSSLQIVL